MIAALCFAAVSASTWLIGGAAQSGGQLQQQPKKEEAEKLDAKAAPKANDEEKPKPKRRGSLRKKRKSSRRRSSGNRSITRSSRSENLQPTQPVPPTNQVQTAKSAPVQIAASPNPARKRSDERMIDQTPTIETKTLSGEYCGTTSSSTVEELELHSPPNDDSSPTNSNPDKKDKEDETVFENGTANPAIAKMKKNRQLMSKDVIKEEKDDKEEDTVFENGTSNPAIARMKKPRQLQAKDEKEKPEKVDEPKEEEVAIENGTTNAALAKMKKYRHMLSKEDREKLNEEKDNEKTEFENINAANRPALSKMKRKKKRESERCEK